MLCMRKKFVSGEDWPLQREERPAEGRREPGKWHLDIDSTGNSTQCSVVT